jgi:plasmid stability protein
MAQVVIEDLDPVVIEKLEALARKHGRSANAPLR